jgi:hypothetical protein
MFVFKFPYKFACPSMVRYTASYLPITICKAKNLPGVFTSKSVAQNITCFYRTPSREVSLTEFIESDLLFSSGT